MVKLQKAVIPVSKVKLYYRTDSYSTVPIQYTVFMILNVFTNFNLASYVMIMGSGLEDASL